MTHPHGIIVGDRPMVVDLHTHSTASDGSETPSTLVEMATRRGLNALALTDHDTVEGIDEARAAAETALSQ